MFEPRQLRHMVSAVRVDGDREAASAQASFAIFECLSDREPHILMVGRYLDRLVREGSELRFRERICVYDNYRIRTTLVIPA